MTSAISVNHPPDKTQKTLAQALADFLPRFRKKMFLVEQPQVRLQIDTIDDFLPYQQILEN